MKAPIFEVVDAGLNELYSLWDELGLDSTSKMERNETVQKYIEDIFNRMVEEENRSKEKILKSLEIHNKKAVKLAKELGVKISSPDSSLVLIRYEQAVRREVERLALIKEERILEFEALQRQEAVLCRQIGEPSSDVRYSEVPPISLVQDLKDRIQTLEQEKAERFEQFLKLKRSILSMYRELELEPGTSLEREIACEDEEKFVLSVENIGFATDILVQLEHKRTVNLQIVEDAIEKIGSLYELLQLDFGEKCEFLAELGGCKSSVIVKLQTEVQRLETLKKEKIGELVIKNRNELDELWDECFYSSDQRNRFTPLHCIEFTEELLELHEEEVANMKEILKENRDILGKVAQWKRTWVEVMELERKSKEPARLMGGGNTLLREERQRKKVNKMLPQLEQELCELIGEWEVSHGKEFLVDGVSFSRYAQEQRDNHALRLDQEKQARNQAKFKKGMQEKTLTGTRLAAAGKTFNVNSVSNAKKAEPGSTVKLCFRTPKRGASAQTASPRTIAKRAPSVSQMDRIKSLKTRTGGNTNFTSMKDTGSSKVTSNDTKSSVMVTINDTRSAINRTKTISDVARTKAAATKGRTISSESSASSATRGLRRG